MNDILNDDCIREIIRKGSVVSAYLFSMTCHHNRNLIAGMRRHKWWRMCHYDTTNGERYERPCNKRDVTLHAVANSPITVLNYLKDCGVTFTSSILFSANKTIPGVFRWLYCNSIEPIPPIIKEMAYNKLIVRAKSEEVIIDARNCIGDVPLSARSCATLHGRYPDLLPDIYKNVDAWILNPDALRFIGRHGFSKCIAHILNSTPELPKISPMIVELLEHEHYLFINIIVGMESYKDSISDELLTDALRSASMTAVQYVSKYNKLTQPFVDDFLRNTLISVRHYRKLFDIFEKMKFKVPPNLFDVCKLRCNDKNVDVFLRAVELGARPDTSGRTIGRMLEGCDKARTKLNAAGFR